VQRNDSAAAETETTLPIASGEGDFFGGVIYLFYGH
jgi:hypothetical protein